MLFDEMAVLRPAYRNVSHSVDLGVVCILVFQLPKKENNFSSLVWLC